MKITADNVIVTLEYNEKEEYPDIKLKIMNLKNRTIFRTIYLSRASKTEIIDIPECWTVINDDV